VYLYLVDAEVAGGPRRRPTPAGENTSAALPILRDSRVRARSSEGDRAPGEKSGGGGVWISFLFFFSFFLVHFKIERVKSQLCLILRPIHSAKL